MVLDKDGTARINDTQIKKVLRSFDYSTFILHRDQLATSTWKYPEPERN